MKQRFDAIVVGAGPAGSACSYTLAKSGLDVLLVERGKVAGAKNMWGGAFYGPTLNQLFPNLWQEAPLERYVTHHKISALTNEDCLTAEYTTIKLAQPPYNGFTILRSKFDRWFVSKVEEAGAIVATSLQADDLILDGKRIIGIKAGNDELPANIVVVCDGVNSVLAGKAGLRKRLKPQAVKQAVKEVIQLPRELIERRFNLTGGEGIAWEFIGSFTRGLPGGAFIYTNKDSLSVGVAVQLSALAEHNIRAVEILEEFKQHPAVASLLDEGKLEEYSAHLIPVYGLAMMPALNTDGLLVAGDAAAFVLGTGLILEGANFAIASGIAAAETVIKAKQAGDFSKKFLDYYPELLRKNFVLKDLETFRSTPHFLENPRIYSLYPELACNLAEKIFINDGRPRKKIRQLLSQATKGRVTIWQFAKDLMQMMRSI